MFSTDSAFVTNGGWEGLSYAKVRYRYFRAFIDANREKTDNETKTVVEAVRPWRQPKPTKTSRPRTLVRNDTSAVDSGADSSARVSGTAATKRKRVWVSFKPSTQYARPRRRDPPEDLESKAPKRADRGWCHESRRFEELLELISGSLM